MLHTLETLNKFKNEKQLFYCEPLCRLLSSNELEIAFELKDTPIYPVLRSELEVTNDINFKAAHGDALVAKSLWGICAGAFPNDASPTGYQSFDGLACVTPRWVEKRLNEKKEDMAKKFIPELLRIYNSTRVYLSTLDENEFCNKNIINMANSCIAFEKSMKDGGE